MAAEQYMRFDPADYLDDMADVAAYGQLALEESAEDPTAVPRALAVISRSGPTNEAETPPAGAEGVI